MKYKIGFEETGYCINGSDVVHIVVTGDTVADSTHRITCNVTLTSTQAEYSQSWCTLMPNGSNRVVIPFVVPIEWANDTKVLDMNGDNGALCASLSVEYVLTLHAKQFVFNYSGYHGMIGATVADHMLPTVGEISYTSVDGKVPEDWDCLVQGVSVVRVSAPQAAGSYGSDIYYYYFNGGTAQKQNFADISLQKAGNITIPVTVEDSRGRLTTADLYLVVQEYQAPTLTQVRTQRCDAEGVLAEEGEYFLASGTLHAADVLGHNNISVTAAWKKVTEAAYGDAIAVQPTQGSIVSASLEQGASYHVRYTIQDAFYSIDLYDYLSSTIYLMHFLKGGAGIAVGKAAEQESLFDVALDTTLRRDLAVGGNVSITGELRLGNVGVKDVLQSLQTPVETQFTVNTQAVSLNYVTENRIVRCGQLVMYSFKGDLAGDEPPLAGCEYEICTIPADCFDADYPPQLMAMQNGASPCLVTVSNMGQVRVTLSQSNQQTIWISGIGMRFAS